VPRLGRLLLEAHRDVPGYGAILRLVSVPFLILALAAMAAAVMELLVAPLMVGTAVLLHLFA
jgi:hypothetical protein